MILSLRAPLIRKLLINQTPTLLHRPTLLVIVEKWDNTGFEPKQTQLETGASGHREERPHSHAYTALEFRCRRLW